MISNGQLIKNISKDGDKELQFSTSRADRALPKVQHHDLTSHLLCSRVRLSRECWGYPGNGKGHVTVVTLNIVPVQEFSRKKVRGGSTGY